MAHKCKSNGGQSVHSLFGENFRKEVKKNYFPQQREEMIRVQLPQLPTLWTLQPNVESRQRRQKTCQLAHI